MSLRWVFYESLMSLRLVSDESLMSLRRVSEESSKGLRRVSDEAPMSLWLVDESLISLISLMSLMSLMRLLCFLNLLWTTSVRPIKLNFCTSCARKSLSEWPPVTPHSSTQILNRSKTLLTLKFYFDSILKKICPNFGHNHKSSVSKIESLLQEARSLYYI